MKFEKGFKFMTKVEDYEVIEFIEQLGMYRLKNLNTGKETELMKENQIQGYIDNIESIQLKREKTKLLVEESEREVKIEQEKELKKKLQYEFCFGYTDNMTALQRGKVLKTLNITIFYNNVQYTRKDFIEKLVEKGYNPTIQDNNVIGKGGKVSRRKNEYCMVNKEKGFISVTKTEFDYAMYLIENNYLKAI